MHENLVNTIINDYNGTIKPLIIPSDLTNGTGITNPSLLVEGDKIHIIMRHVEYTLYLSEGEQKYQSDQAGPLSYYHREDKNELRTNNYYSELDPETLEIKNPLKVDTSTLDSPPLWEFIGLEDARLIRWDNKYFLCGVRRDTTISGKGRMEMSEILINDDNVIEVNRDRIEVPNKESYCEKNWMPIIDKPFHFIKWTNPTEVVQVDLEQKNCKQVYLSDKVYDLPFDIRGGSPLIEWTDDSYICITHEVDLTLKNINGFKNADYYHRFIIFNKDYSIQYISDHFNFMTAKVEFCISLVKYKNDILIAFGFQDNCSYIIKINRDKLEKLIYGNLYNNIITDKPLQLIKHINDDYRNTYPILLLKNIKNFLDDQNVPFWLDAGTLLGAVRDKGFIKGDNDIDISVHQQDANININKLPEYGLRILNLMPLEDCSPMTYIQLELDGYGKPNSEVISTLDIYIHTYKPYLEKITFLDIDYNVPKNPELFLTQVYGDWKVPSKYTGNTELWECGFIDTEYSKYIEINKY
tara:strand:+ start:536 stop:2110 length:1575 start_codon:yes stop_codon:yes gene_type:complete